MMMTMTKITYIVSSNSKATIVTDDKRKAVDTAVSYIGGKTALKESDRSMIGTFMENEQSTGSILSVGPVSNPARVVTAEKV